MRNEFDFSKGKRGAIIASPGKTRITIMLDNDVIEHFRQRAEAAGSGYQTEINRILREHMASNGQVLTLEALRGSSVKSLMPRRTHLSAESST